MDLDLTERGEGAEAGGRMDVLPVLEGAGTVQQYVTGTKVITKKLPYCLKPQNPVLNKYNVE